MKATTTTRLICLLVGGASFAAPCAKDLCKPNEIVVWSCSAKRRVYSVCASKDLSRNTGYMQYRVAKNDKMEWQFPEAKTRPASLFSFSLLAKGGMLSFENEEYKYELYEGLAGMPSISVWKDDKSFSEVDCEDGSLALTLTTTLNLLDSAGVYVRK